MAEDKVKIKFLRDEVYETEGRNQGKQFTAGRVYAMTADQAGRWIRRDAAELVEEGTAEEEGPSKPRRGRPPKAKAAENGDEVDDDEDDDEDDEPEPAPKPPEPAPKPPEPEPKPPGPSPIATPASPVRQPYKGR